MLSVCLVLPKLRPFISEQTANVFCILNASTFIFDHPLLFIPYLLRAYRLYVIFKLDFKENTSETLPPYQTSGLRRADLRSLKKVREKCLLLILFLAFIPFVILFLVFVTVKGAEDYYPYNQITSCFLADLQDEFVFVSYQREEPINISIAVAIAVNFLVNVLFAMTIYKLRHISDEFSISEELKLAFISWGLSGFCISLSICFIQVSLSWSFYTYFYNLRNLILFTVSLTIPLRKSFQTAYKIPYETKYCADNFRIASQTHLPSLFFNQFLKKEYPRTGLFMFQLFMDIRIYQNLNSSVTITDHETSFLLSQIQYHSPLKSTLSNKTPRNEPRSLDTDARLKGIQIFNNYLARDAPFRVKIKEEILKQIQDSMINSSSSFSFTAGIFDQILQNISERLEGYYVRFKNSKSFKELLKELEMREIQHNLFMRLKMYPTYK